MNKLVATLCVISWSGFWAFGYIALSSGGIADSQLTIAMILAALGMFTGIFTYLKLARAADPAGRQRVRQAEGA